MRGLLATVALLASGGAAWAQSLLGEGGGSPYDPPRAPAYKKHDRLLVRWPAAVPTAEGASGRRSPGQLGLEEWARLDRGQAPAPRTPEPAAEARADRPAESSAALPVEVVDVRPNGILVVQAIRRRRLNGLEETLRVTGEVSPRDVSAGEVELDRVAHLVVALDGGAARLPAWLAGLFGRIGF